MFWDWDYVWQALPQLYRGSLVTIQATFVGFGIAVSLGLACALLRRSRISVVRIGIAEFVEFVRSTPLLLQVFFVYFVGPQIGISLPGWVAGVGVLGIHYAAYCSEVYRAGIECVDHGQWEACTALNLSRARSWRAVILPQAIPLVIPGLGNYLISMLKDTPILAAISILELLQQAKNFGGENYRYTEVITMAGLFYLLFSLIASLFVRAGSYWLNRRYHLD